MLKISKKKQMYLVTYLVIPMIALLFIYMFYNIVMETDSFLQWIFFIYTSGLGIMMIREVWKDYKIDEDDWNDYEIYKYNELI